MQTRFNILSALVACITLVSPRTTSAPLAVAGDVGFAPRVEHPVESKTPNGAALSADHVAEVVADLRAETAGDVLIVDCNGHYDYVTIQGAIGASRDGDVIVVQNTVLRRNNDKGRGGGLRNENGSPLIVRCVFRKNEAYTGGALSIVGGGPKKSRPVRSLRTRLRLPGD